MMKSVNAWIFIAQYGEYLISNSISLSLQFSMHLDVLILVKLNQLNMFDSTMTIWKYESNFLEVICSV